MAVGFSIGCCLLGFFRRKRKKMNTGDKKNENQLPIISSKLFDFRFRSTACGGNSSFKLESKGCSGCFGFSTVKNSI
jgi:hypothetical protein